jgi:hypothetical protein
LLVPLKSGSEKKLEGALVGTHKTRITNEHAICKYFLLLQDTPEGLAENWEDELSAKLVAKNGMPVHGRRTLSHYLSRMEKNGVMKRKPVQIEPHKTQYKNRYIIDLKIDNARLRKEFKNLGDFLTTLTAEINSNEEITNVLYICDWNIVQGSDTRDVEIFIDTTDGDMIGRYLTDIILPKYEFASMPVTHKVVDCMRRQPARTMKVKEASTTAEQGIHDR